MNERVLGTDSVIAVDRFNPDKPTTYIAASGKNPVMRATRQEALQDEKAYWADKDEVKS